MQKELIYQVENWKPYSNSTFSGKGKVMATLVPVHHVNPHYVQSHFREGKYISGYWRDGDGNTKVNTYRGYYAKNPGAKPVSVILNKKGH